MRRILPKSIMAGGLALLALPFALACGSAQAEELRLWTLTFSPEATGKAFQSIVDQFEKANPGVTVKVEQRGTDEHKAALRVAANSDQAPDIFFSWAGLGLGGEFVKSGLALDMTKYYQQYKWNDEFLPAAAAFSTQYPGGTFGVPNSFRGEALYYSKKLFAKAGITAPPTTWAELDADAAKLKSAGIPAITFGGSVNWHLMRLMDTILEAECGVDKHDALMATKLDWTKEACAGKSFEEFHSWTSKYVLKPFMGIDDSQSFKLFLAGRAAMMLEGDWLVGRLADAKRADDFGVFPLPTGTDRLYGFADYYYISSKSKYPDLAAKFLDFFASTQVQQSVVGNFGLISANKNVKPTSTAPLDLAWEGIFGAAKGTFVNGDQAFPLDITTEYWRIINEVASDNLEPAKAAGDLQTFIAAHPVK